MVWALLAAILGVPIWLIVGALLSTLWQRRQIRAMPGVFPCKARVFAGSFDGLDAKWPRMTCRGQWMHNVLMIHRGFGFVRVTPLGVRFVDRGVAPVQGVKGLGDYAVSLRATLDDGEIIEVAATATDGTALAGPFMAAVAGSDWHTPRRWVSGT